VVPDATEEGAKLLAGELFCVGKTSVGPAGLSIQVFSPKRRFEQLHLMFGL